MSMDAHEIATMLSEVLNIAACAADPDLLAEVPEEMMDVAAIHSYEEDGILTRDAGFVLHMAGGEAFQVTVVRSR